MPPDPYGFSPAASSAALNSQIRLTRAEAARAGQEAVTGWHQDPAAALGGRVGPLLDTTSRLAEIAVQGRSLSLAQTRAGAQQAALEQIGAATDRLIETATSALESPAPATRATVAAEALAALETSISALNTAQGGRSLFTGDRADRPALLDAEGFRNALRPLLAGATGPADASAILSDAFNSAGGLFDTTLYTGGTSDAPAVEAAVDQRIDYALRADEGVFRSLLRDLSGLAEAFTEPPLFSDEDGTSLARSALDNLRSSRAGLDIAAARLGTAEAQIAAAAERNVAAETEARLLEHALAGRDPFEAATELTALESQIEGLFLTSVRLSQLSLTRFLR